MNGPRFSVIIPAYNRGAVILNTLESIRRQGYGERVEVIVVDDSSDNTPELVRDYAAAHPELKLVYFHPPQRARAAGARNKGLELASGDFAVILDSDDTLTDGALARIEAQMTRCRCAVLLSGVIAISGASMPYNPRFLDRPLSVGDYLQSFHLPEMMATLDIAFARRHDLNYLTDVIGFEGLFYLRMIRAGGILVRDAHPVRLYDDIGETRQSTAENILKVSGWMAQGHGQLFAEFGPDMRRAAPALYRKTLIKAAMYARIARIPMHDAVARHLLARLIGALPRSLLRRVAIAFK